MSCHLRHVHLAAWRSNYVRHSHLSWRAKVAYRRYITEDATAISPTTSTTPTTISCTSPSQVDASPQISSSTCRRSELSWVTSRMAFKSINITFEGGGPNKNIDGPIDAGTIFALSLLPYHSIHLRPSPCAVFLLHSCSSPWLPLPSSAERAHTDTMATIPPTPTEPTLIPPPPSTSSWARVPTTSSTIWTKAP